MSGTATWRLVDTHTHLCDPAFDEDRAAVMARAREAGVVAVISVSENLQDARRNLDLARTHPEIYPAAGLYPTELDLDRLQAMEDWIRAHREALIGIGEVGLDHWKVQDERERELQQRILARFVALGRELDLPLNVHSRAAGRHTVEFLIAHGARRVQLHAFDGRIGAARPAVEAGYFFSIPASVVRSRQKQKLARHLPLSCLLLETDSPVLAPEPGERNEPARVVVALEAAARLKEISPQRLAEIVTANTQRLYGIPG